MFISLINLVSFGDSIEGSECWYLPAWTTKSWRHRVWGDKIATGENSLMAPHTYNNKVLKGWPKASLGRVSLVEDMDDDL